MKKSLLSLFVAFVLAVVVSTTALAGFGIAPKIMAGQNDWVGAIRVIGNADGSLTLTFSTWGGHCMTDAAVHVGLSLSDFPQNKGGAIPGKFDYKYDFGGCVTSATRTIADPPGEKGQLYLAAHTNIYGPDGQQDTGWSVICGDLEAGQFPGKNWSAWFTFPAAAWY